MIEKLPSKKQCLDLLKKSGCHDNVIKHSLAVEGLALKMAEFANADKKLVSAGALLHDIGRGRTHGIQHAIEGARLARELELPVEIVLIIERHIGAGISKEESEKIGLPKKDYIPQTLEEKIVAHADNLIYENEKKSVKEVVNCFKDMDNDYIAIKIQNLHEELCEICGIDLDDL